jgi:predicted transport protein
MKAIDSPFTKIINGTTQFVIPVFQRDYTWDAETQCGQLWRDVLRASGSGGDRGHFLGSIVYVATGDSLAGFTRWMLIDGQQRLTTLTLLVAALRDHIREINWTGGENDPTPVRIDAYFLKNLQEEGDRKQKLVLRRHDQATLRAIIDGKEPPPNPSEHIRDNYQYFREQLSSVDPADVYRGVGRLIIVDVALDRQTDDPQLIFESLNSTGVDLSQADLIRNFILMRLPEKEQTELYETYWSKIEALFKGSEWTFDAFARDYVALKTEASKQKNAAEIYYAFREFFPTLTEKCGGLREVLSDMMRHARHYAAFSIGRDVTGERGRALAEIRRHVDVPAILITRLLDYRDNMGVLREDELLEALRLIESYTVRRAVCGYQTRGYWQIFANLAYGIGEKHPLQDLKVALARQHENYRFPSDEDFEGRLKEAELYGLRVCRHLLEGLENFGSKEPTDTSSYSIEHIMPQNERLRRGWREMLGGDWKEIQKTWLHRLGNLTLTGYNTTYSDREFDEKKTIEGGFSDSSVRLNKFVREQPVWTPKEMTARTNELIKRALKVWPPLEVEKALVDAADHLEKRRLAARQDLSKIKMTAEAKVLYEALRSQVMTIDSDIMELAEPNSISYHGPNFFLEVLPRAHKLTLLIALDFNEVDDPSGLAKDATEKKFFVHARHEGGVSMSIWDTRAVEKALAIIRQAYSSSNE